MMGDGIMMLIAVHKTNTRFHNLRGHFHGPYLSRIGDYVKVQINELLCNRLLFGNRRILFRGCIL